MSFPQLQVKNVLKPFKFPLLSLIALYITSCSNPKAGVPISVIRNNTDSNIDVLVEVGDARTVTPGRYTRVDSQKTYTITYKGAKDQSKNVSVKSKAISCLNVNGEFVCLVVKK